MSCRIYLIGAGPGDPGLLTIKGKQLIEKADVIIYDKLVSESILNLAQQDCERIFVGKSPGKHYRLQEKINELLIEKASAGGIIVRLKGGDPFVFGRGSEEALELSKQGIDFEIVPGVSSALAVPAYAGIPMTHRGLSSSFTVVTGHEDPTKLESSIAWEHVSKNSDTLVFLMGMKNLPFITRKLMDFGMDAQTPVALIENGTGPKQRTVCAQLDSIVSLAKERDIRNPAIIVIGEVVRLRENIEWFEKKPLFGERILVTRARQQSSKLSSALTDLGAYVHELPVIAFEVPLDLGHMDPVMEQLYSYSWLIFSSVNGVDAFFKELSSRNLDIRELAGIKLIAIGPATQKHLESKGLRNILVPSRYDADSLVEEFLGQIRAGEKVLIVRPEQARDVIAKALRESGVLVSEIAAYRTVSADVDTKALVASLAIKEFDAITFTSSSTVQNLMHMISGDLALLQGVKLCSIGPVTSDTLREYGLEPSIEASNSSVDGLVEAMLIDKHSPLSS